jgi:hypothetical protein
MEVLQWAIYFLKRNKQTNDDDDTSSAAAPGGLLLIYLKVAIRFLSEGSDHNT